MGGGGGGGGAVAVGRCNQWGEGGCRCRPIQPVGEGGGGSLSKKDRSLRSPPPPPPPSPLPGYGPQRGRGSSRWAKYERTKGRKAPSGLMQSTITNRPVARYCVGGGGGGGGGVQIMAQWTQADSRVISEL